MPTALVTGATGLVGSHIGERLLRERWTVRALVRSTRAERDALAVGMEPVRGDVLDAEAFNRAAHGADTIFHTAANITPRGGWEVFRHLNIDGTRNAIAAAEASGARLLHLSSVAVYGADTRYRAGGEATDEDTPLAPLPERAYYGRSKRESERLVMEAHAQGRIWAAAVRPDVIYGRRDRQFVPRLAKLLRHGVAPVIDGGRAILAVVHVANVADGAVLAATSDVAGGRAYNLANDYDVSVAEFFRLAGEGLGVRMRLLNIPEPVARGLFKFVKVAVQLASGGRLRIVSSSSIDFITRDNPFSSARARRELGWVPAVHPRDGVPDAFRWWAERRAARARGASRPARGG